MKKKENNSIGLKIVKISERIYIFHIGSDTLGSANIKKKKKKKKKKKTLIHFGFFVFVVGGGLNEEGPKILCGLDSDHRSVILTVTTEVWY